MPMKSWFETGAWFAVATVRSGCTFAPDEDIPSHDEG
jgi:hypothetical protein